MPSRRLLLAAGAAMTTARLLAQPVAASADKVRRVKARIVALARAFAGQGDPDFAHQNAFAPLIAELLSLRPQEPRRRASNPLWRWQVRPLRDDATAALVAVVA
jgi:hypothetical protein